MHTRALASIALFLNVRGMTSSCGCDNDRLDCALNYQLKINSPLESLLPVYAVTARGNRRANTKIVPIIGFPIGFINRFCFFSDIKIEAAAVNT